MFTQPDFTNLKWNKMSFRLQLARIRQLFMILVFLSSLLGMNPSPVLADSPAGVLEDFETSALPMVQMWEHMPTGMMADLDL